MGEELAGQVAIVTGGGTGIGRAIAQGLAMSGAAVTVVGRRVSELGETVALIAEAGGYGAAFPADITDWGAMQQLVAATEERYGPVDLLVNNASVVHPLAPVWEVEPEDWRRAVDINLTGTFLCTRAVLPGMVARRRGRVITISTGGIRRPVRYSAAYASTKLGAARVMETLAEEVRPYGIAVFLVFPGVVLTPMLREMGRSAWAQQVFGDEARILQGAQTPPERPAELCRFLASGAADALSGRTFNVADDELDLVGRADEIVQRDLYAFRFPT